MSELSRRSVIMKGAGLAAAGVVVGAAVPLTASALSDEPGKAMGAADNPELPVMVHLRDARTGDFDVFVGTERVKVTDRAFAARLSQIASA